MNNALRFSKYHGAGNDFVMIDHMDKAEIKIDIQDHTSIQKLCHRHFGIGADGLIILESDSATDYYMRYFNADGRPGSFCGNGSRCCFAFARENGYVGKRATFRAADGSHQAHLDGNTIYVKMEFGNEIIQANDFYWLDTGSPHYVQFCEDVSVIDAYSRGREIRYSDEYHKEGVNVNFVEYRPEGLFVKTYERGVENVTLACGTGVTAAAIAHMMEQGLHGLHEIPIEVLGGRLTVKLRRQNDQFLDIWLGGPAEKVFEGIWKQSS